MGKHSLRFGGEAIQYQLNRFNNFAVRGALTTGAHQRAAAIRRSRHSRISCEGRVTAIQSAFGDPARNFIATDYAAFVQDDYRWSPRLTFNLGLRWEGMSFGHDKLYRAGVFDPSLAAAGLNPFLIPEKVNLAGFRGTPGVSDCALRSCFDGNNFAPRVGFAWDISGRPEDGVARRLRYLLPTSVESKHSAELVGSAVHRATAIFDDHSGVVPVSESVREHPAAVDHRDGVHSFGDVLCGLERCQLRACRQPTRTIRTLLRSSLTQPDKGA